MPEFKVGSLKELGTLLGRHMKERQQRTTNAIRRAARKGTVVVKKNVPVAFGELRESVEAIPLEPGGARIIADAPHAEAVELGTRPHWVPLADLVKWVQLRGMQGLATERQIQRLPGSSTARQARYIAQQLRGHALQDAPGALAADAPLQVAKAIQLAIAAHGTKPQPYMKTSEPEILTILKGELDAAMPEQSS